MAASELFLGVDGGQSSTTALIGDAAGKIVGWGSAGPCNHVHAAEARAKFLAVMRECLSQAATRARVDDWPLRLKAACMGMSGGPDTAFRTKASYFLDAIASWQLASSRCTSL